MKPNTAQRFELVNKARQLRAEQVKDAEENLAFAKAQYVKAKKELVVLQQSHTRLCSSDCD